MKRPAGFDEKARVPVAPPVARRPRLERRPKDDSPLLETEGTVAAGPTEESASRPPAAVAAAAISKADAGSGAATATRIMRELRDSVLPGKPAPGDEEAGPRAPLFTRERLEPQDRQARAELRRAARRRRRFDKKEVRRFTRRSRRRKITLLVAAGIVTVMGGLVAVAVYSPLLALRTISIDGTSRIDAADLQDAVDGQLGTPLALLDNDRITDELGDFPLIRSFVTETVPPDTLVIHVVERQPIGSLPTPEGFALVDPAGVVIERSSARIPGVPLIDIPPGDTGGEGTGGAAFDAAVEVLIALPDPVLGQLDTITATTRDDVRLAIAGTGATIIWGSADDSEYKARVLAALLVNVPTASEFNVSAPGQGTYKP